MQQLETKEPQVSHKRKTAAASRGRKAKKKTTPSQIGMFFESVHQQHGAAFTRTIMFLVLGAAGIMAVTVGLRAMQRNVLDDQDSAIQRDFHIELIDAPDWMPKELHRDIIKNITPAKTVFGSKSFCGDIFTFAKANPWISEVYSVRRIQTERIDKQNVVIVRAKFRQPFARVPFEGGMVYFDEHGYVLPSKFVPIWESQSQNPARRTTYVTRYHAPEKASRIHYITIKGVGIVPPVAGQKWDTDDLRAGIKMIKLIKTKKYAYQITVADVGNHAKRVSDTAPELVYYAQVGRDKRTAIRFGRFPHPDGGDWIVPLERKMRYLDEYVSSNNGRLAGKNEYLDLRFDELIISIN
jgi:hypothetical protein